MAKDAPPGGKRPSAPKRQRTDTPDHVQLPDDIKATEQPGPSLKERIAHIHEKYQSLSLQQRIATMSIMLFVVIGAGSLTYAFWPRQDAPDTAPQIVVEEPEPEEKPSRPNVVASELTGRQIKPQTNKRQVIGVMIENSPDARPQSGLRDAGVVYEAIAEGGITRFLALFLDEAPSYIGPVRSARTYFVQWARPYDAPYAHVGGSATGLAEIRRIGVKDLDQFSNPGAYRRVNTRYAPHNMYTDLSKLRSVASSRGWKTSTFNGFGRKAEPLYSKPKATRINFDISHSQYNVSYQYDKASNSYLRNMGGLPHRDERSGKQLHPRVVVGLVTNQGYEPDGLHLTYRTTGKGRAFIFQNGKVQKVFWQRKNKKAPLRFTDKSGNTVRLIPGQTWVTALGGAERVNYR